MLTLTLHLWKKYEHKPVHSLPAPVQQQQFQHTYYPSNPEHANWSVGKDNLNKNVSALCMELGRLWHGQDWVVPGVLASPADPEHQKKWGNKVRILKVAREFAELRGVFTIPEDKEDFLYCVYVENLDPKAKKHHPFYRCIPSFLVPFTEEDKA